MSALSEKINSAEYVYSSYTKWGLKRYVCDVEYYIEEPLDDMYFVICSILNNNSGYYDKVSLGVLLGFALSDQISSEGHEVYRDRAEIGLFEDILSKVEAEHLIKIQEKGVLLTRLGQISVRERKHYQFFSGTQGLYEHSSLKSEDPKELLLFPFYDDMGIGTELIKTKQIWPEAADIEKTIFYENNQLINRLQLHSEIPSHIYAAELHPYFDFEVRRIPVNLYQYGEEYIPAIMNGSEVAFRATELVCEEVNAIKKENIVLECLFQKLWDDKLAVLDYNALEPYAELIDYEELAKDARTVWSDDKLFCLIAEHASSTCWRNLTLNCTIDVLRKYVGEYKEFLDWQILTERIDDGFLLAYFLEYPWDLEVLSEDMNRKESVLEQLIVLQKETEDDWNWDELEKRLSQRFVLSHLDFVKVNLASYTNDSEEVREAILKNVDKRWDWNKIEEEFDLQFIYDNIELLGSHLNFVQLFDRAFTDAYWSEKFVTNVSFRSSVETASKPGGVLSSAIFNDRAYSWSTKLIDLFVENNLLSWSSTPYMVGFECNPHLIWSKGFFEKYSQNITTDSGRRYVSAQIVDVSTISNSPDFEWNWDAISSNESLLSNVQLFTSFGNRLNWCNVLAIQKDSSFLQSIPDINTMLGDDSKAWSLFSGIASIDYVEKKFRESKYPWDWSVLTERMFQRLKLDNIGNSLFVDKWNWSYLAGHVSEDFLINNLEKYKTYWNWGIALPRVLSEERRLDLVFLDQLAGILSGITDGEKRQAAWAALTSQYSFRELKKLIKATAHKSEYSWDVGHLCQHKDFYVFRDLDDCRNFIDWDILSSSPEVDVTLRYNPKLGIKEKAWRELVRNLLADSRNHWNFMLVSHFDSLKDERWFITLFKEKIDWDYISLTSKLFCEKDKQTLNEIIEAYRGYINFKVLSERSDVDIQQIIKINPSAEYDYNELIKKRIVDVDLKLIESMPNYPWDWQMVSTSPLFDPTLDFLLTHLNDDLNWKAISKQDNHKAWGSKVLVLDVASDPSISKQIDWYCLSSRQYFPLSEDILKAVPVKELNWKCLSGRKAIAHFIDDYIDLVDWHVFSNNSDVITSNIDVLEKYKKYLDWSVVCSKDDFVFTNEIIDKFSDYIDWSLASESTTILFSESLVDKYKDKWDWPVLVKNKAFYNTVDISGVPYAKQTNIVEFINKFPRTPKAYHFTHMENAVNIIRSMKLQSRNYADGKFSNSAGTNVHRTGKAHGFARFYFMPKSPTQFYNEFLGKDIDDKYYRRALNLGLPKCPLPVFFIFDIQELLSVMPDLCYYSNGNMQKDSSKCFKVVENPNRIKAREIYINNYETFDERQQEFLVEGELDFSKLKNVQICCFDSFQGEMLKQELKGTKWENVVSVDPSLYEHENKELFFKEDSETIEIKTNYHCPFEFRVSFTGSQVPEIVNANNVIRQRGKNIYVSNFVQIKRSVPYQVYFEVNSPNIGSWLIYNNK